MPDEVLVLLRRPGKDPYEDDAHCVDAHHFSHSGLGVLVPHKQVGAHDQVHAGLEVPAVGMSKPLTVRPVVVNPQVPIHLIAIQPRQGSACDRGGRRARFVER